MTGTAYNQANLASSLMPPPFPCTIPRFSVPPSTLMTSVSGLPMFSGSPLSNVSGLQTIQRDPQSLVNLGVPKEPLHTLFVAALQGNIVVLCDILDHHNVPVDAQDLEGTSALILASANNQLYCVRELLQRGANPTLIRKTGTSALFFAAQGGFLSIIEEVLHYCRLIEGSQDFRCHIPGSYQAPLLPAAQNGHVACIDVLLKATSVWAGDVNVQMRDGGSPLFLAAQAGHERVVQMLLDHGAIVDLARKDGTTPLFIAAQMGHQAVCKQLIDAGAFVDAPREDGTTALFKAAQKGHCEVVQLLLEGGSSIGLLGNGESALHAATLFGRAKICHLLLVRGADPLLTNKEGLTSVDLAQETRLDYVVKILDNFADRQALGGPYTAPHSRQTTPGPPPRRRLPAYYQPPPNRTGNFARQGRGRGSRPGPSIDSDVYYYGDKKRVSAPNIVPGSLRQQECTEDFVPHTDVTQTTDFTAFTHQQVNYYHEYRFNPSESAGSFDTPSFSSSSTASSIPNLSEHQTSTNLEQQNSGHHTVPIHTTNDDCHRSDANASLSDRPAEWNPVSFQQSYILANPVESVENQVSVTVDVEESFILMETEPDVLIEPMQIDDTDFLQTEHIKTQNLASSVTSLNDTVLNQVSSAESIQGCSYSVDIDKTCVEVDILTRKGEGKHRINMADSSMSINEPESKVPVERDDNEQKMPKLDPLLSTNKLEMPIQSEVCSVMVDVTETPKANSNDLQVDSTKGSEIKSLSVPGISSHSTSKGFIRQIRRSGNLFSHGASRPGNNIPPLPCPSKTEEPPPS